MKKIMILISLLIIIWSGCLTYRTMTYRIHFNDTMTGGTVQVEYFDIGSSEEKPEQHQKDFYELLDMFQGDKFLLDKLNEGIYVKSRGIYEKDNTLVGSFEGIFAKLKVDDEPLTVRKNERILLLDTGDMDIGETDARIIRTENSVMLVWPKDRRDIYFTLRPKSEEPTYSLLSFYRQWITKKKTD